MAEDTPPCTGAHCSAESEFVNNKCKKNNWAQGHKVLVCDDNGQCCYCHCSCFQFGTLVAVSKTKFTKIEQLKVKDAVIAAGTDLKWTPVVVEYSGGTESNTTTPFMIEVSYNEASEIKKLVCTKDQPFLLSNKLLKRADKLTTSDSLMLATGTTAKVKGTRFVTVDNGVHHISTGTEKPINLDNHLLNIQGVVAADYAVQLFQDELSIFFEKDPSDAVRSKAEIIPGDIKSFSFAEYRKNGSKHKYPSLPNTLLTHTLKMPDDASTFVGSEQAKQIKAFVPKNSIDDSGIIYDTEYLFGIYGIAYPQVKFTLAWYNDTCNAYAYKEKDEYFVVIDGGLARCKPLGFHGMGIVIAHELGHLFGGSPEGKDGYSCEAQADFYGVGIAMSRTWYDSLYQQMVFGGIDDVTNLFSYLSNDTRKITGCITPTLTCRLASLRAGATSPYLPACAGGPKYEFLAVKAARSDEGGEVNIYFNEAVDTTTARNVKNYTTIPLVKIDAVIVNTIDPTVVRVIANFEKGGNYRITVSDVIAKNRESIDPKKNKADFVAK